VRVLVITPTQKELNFLLRGCDTLGFKTQNSQVGKLPVAQHLDLGITLSCGGVGKAQFAAQTQHLLDSCADWGLVMCAGAAGGLVDEVTIGDLVVATATVEHDYKNRFSQRHIPKFDGAPAAIADLRRIKFPAAFRVHFGIAASGDEDVVDGERRKVLAQSTGALVVAWEGAGGARACAFSGVPFVEIRGVTDTACQNAPSEHEANVEMVMHNVAMLLVTWLSRSQEPSNEHHR
jgi:adenosylhomocysteine nucleosidase